MKYKIAFQEIVTSHVEIEAESLDQAIEIVLSGEFEGETVVNRETEGEPYQVIS